MDFHDAWAEALQKTEFVRMRVALLQTFAETAVPYVLLSPSTINDGDTVVRRGRVQVQRPTLVLPPNIPQFEGFDFEHGEAERDRSVVDFLLVRGVAIPSLKYNNQMSSLDLFEGDVASARSFFANQLERAEDVETGLLIGPEEIWPFSLLIFICSQIARNTESDLKRLMDEYRRREDI